MNHSILVELARALSRDDFVKRLPDPVLIVMTEMDQDEASGEDDTQVGEETAGKPKGERNSVGVTFETLALRKKRHATDKERITLGRDRGCDVVVRTPGVSKLHAWFLPGPPLRVADAGSQNGTFVDDRRLTPEQPVDLSPGARIVFGDLSTRLASPEELYVLLKTKRS